MLLPIREGTLALAMVFVAAATSAQTVDELIAKNLDAKGGAEKLKTINTVKVSGKVLAQGAETPMTTWVKRPNMMRQELVFQGSTVVNGFDGTTAWQISPMTGSGAREITGPQADMARQQAEFDTPFLGYKQRGYAIELIGTETFKDRPVHHLKVTSKTGQVQHYYLDAESGLEVKISMTMEQGGMKAEIVNEASNYQKVNGLTFPFVTRQLMNGNVVARITLDKVEFNVPIEDSLFRMPEKK